MGWFRGGGVSSWIIHSTNPTDPRSFLTCFHHRDRPCLMRFLMHKPELRSHPARFPRRPLALLAWLLLQGTTVGAQVAQAGSDEPPPQLKTSPLLQEQVDPA